MAEKPAVQNEPTAYPRRTPRGTVAGEGVAGAGTMAPFKPSKRPTDSPRSVFTPVGDGLLRREPFPDRAGRPVSLHKAFRSPTLSEFVDGQKDPL